MNIEKVVNHLLIHCGFLKQGERLLIICDPSTQEISSLFQKQAQSIGVDAESITIPSLGMHGREPPFNVATAMLGADLIIGVTRHSMAHTKARIEAGKSGARYLSLPDYSLDLLKDPALTADFQAQHQLVQRFSNAFTKGSMVRVQTLSGTDISIDISGRIGNSCPGYVKLPGDLGSPPDIEANISPIESGSNGFVLVDGSIPCSEIGLLSDPVGLHVSDGRITKFEGPRQVVEQLKSLFLSAGSTKAYVLAECGVGLNHKAKLTGAMLTDEGAMGTMHFGFGSNATVGGLNDVPFHLDFVFCDASLFVDGVSLLNNGKITE